MILEKLIVKIIKIYIYIYIYICTNNILVKEKYGFRTNSSTKNASHNVINEILKAMNNWLSIGGIFCDLKQAFDCANCGILVDKLEFYEINGKFLSLIQSYFRERYQKVFIDKINAYDSVSSSQKMSQMGWYRVWSWVL